MCGGWVQDPDHPVLHQPRNQGNLCGYDNHVNGPPVLETDGEVTLFTSSRHALTLMIMSREKYLQPKHVVMP